MNHGHGAENKVNLLVGEHGVISKCCSLRNETNSDKLKNWKIESFSLSSRSWFNNFNVSPNYQKLKEYYLTRLAIITPDAIIPILIFFLCSLELNNKKLYVIIKIWYIIQYWHIYHIWYTFCFTLKQTVA